MTITENKRTYHDNLDATLTINITTNESMKLLQSLLSILHSMIIPMTYTYTVIVLVVLPANSKIYQPLVQLQT